MSTTTFYPQQPESLQKQQNLHQLVKDQEWLLDHMIIPKLPSVLVAVKAVLSYLVLNQTFKLPITSNASEHLKGVIVRKSFEVKGLNLQINKVSHFHNSSLYKSSLKPDMTIELVQIKQTIRMLGFVLMELHVLVASIRASSASRRKLSVNQRLKCHLVFLKKFNQIYSLISRVGSEIDKPDPAMLFPRKNLNSGLFSPGLDLNKLSIDLFLNSGEVYIELIFLKKITVKPWCFINQYGVPFHEFLNDRFLHSKHQNISVVVDHYLDERNWSKFWTFKGNSSINLLKSSSESSSSSLRSPTASIKSSSKSVNSPSSPSSPKFSAQDKPTAPTAWIKQMMTPKWSATNQLYLNRNIKFNNGIYWVLKNLQVKIGDPILIIINIKLNSIRAWVQNSLTNMKNLIVNPDFLGAVVDKSEAFLTLQKDSDNKDYDELINQLFNNANDDLLEASTTFDVTSYLKSREDEEMLGKLAVDSKGSYEDLSGLEIDEKIIEDFNFDFEEIIKEIEECDDELIKEISGLINEGNSSFTDSYSCCEFDVE